jgi:hypothetical protein
VGLNDVKRSGEVRKKHYPKKKEQNDMKPTDQAAIPPDDPNANLRWRNLTKIKASLTSG